MAKEWMRFRGWGYVVLTWFPYQMALGLSLRWFEARPHLRLYLGPFKVALGGSEPFASR